MFVWWCLTPLSTIFQLYRGISFIGGGHWRTRRKPVTSHWQTLSHNVVHLALIEMHDRVFFSKSRYSKWWSRCGCDRMVGGFTTTYAISAYHHWCYWKGTALLKRQVQSRSYYMRSLICAEIFGVYWKSILLSTTSNTSIWFCLMLNCISNAFHDRVFFSKSRYSKWWSRCGCDRMVGGFTTTYAISATFNNISAISWDQFYWWRTLEDPEKTCHKSLTNFIT
jgi:hypothetical protein